MQILQILNSFNQQPKVGLIKQIKCSKDLQPFTSPGPENQAKTRQTGLTTIGDFFKYSHSCQMICTLACETLEQTN